MTATTRERRREVDGRYANEKRCDGCGQSVDLNDFGTDEEVCGNGDGPGFYLCTRKRCTARLSKLGVETRRATYALQRARTRGLRASR